MLALDRLHRILARGDPCLALAMIEFAAWVLIAPPRSILSGDFLVRIRPNPRRRFLGRQSGFGRPTEPVWPADGWPPGIARHGRTVILLHGFAEASTALEAQRAAA